MTAAWSSSEADPDRRRRDQYLYRTYRITLAQYEAILELQGGVCALCEKPPKKRNLSVDHDHRTGEVRGLLCDPRCNNQLLGTPRGVDKDPSIFLRAHEYLIDPPARKILLRGNGVAP